MKVRILRPRSAQPDPNSVIGRLVREGRHTQDDDEATLPAGKPAATFTGDHTAYVADDGTIRVYKTEAKPISSAAELNQRNREFWRRKAE